MMATFTELPADTVLTKAQIRKMRVLFRAMQDDGRKLRNRKRGKGPVSAKRRAKAAAEWKARVSAKGSKGKGIAKGSKGLAKGSKGIAKGKAAKGTYFSAGSGTSVSGAPS